MICSFCGNDKVPWLTGPQVTICTECVVGQAKLKSDKIAILLFTEGDFDSVVLRDSLAEARAFQSGATTGASKYAGSLSVFIVGEVDEPTMEDAVNEGHLTQVEVDKGMAKLKTKLEKLAKERAK